MRSIICPLLFGVGYAVACAICGVKGDSWRIVLFAFLVLISNDIADAIWKVLAP